jgi:hypothetical protein
VKLQKHIKMGLKCVFRIPFKYIVMLKPARGPGVA